MPYDVPMLEAKNIGRYADDRWLLRNASLSLSGGDRLAIVGTMGSGKSLLLRAIAMLDPVEEGEVRFHDRVPHGYGVVEFRSRVIYLRQRPSLIEGTVEEHLQRPFRLGIHQKNQQHYSRSRIVAWVESLGRDASLIDLSTRNLSGGESQVVALLTAIQLDPDILLLDEPTAALDRASVHAVELLVDQWMAEAPEKRALVWVSHDPAQVDRVANQTLFIHQGKLSKTASPV